MNIISEEEDNDFMGGNRPEIITNDNMIKIDKIPVQRLSEIDLSSTDNLIFKMLPQGINNKLGKRYLTFYITEKLNNQYNINKSIFENILYDREMFDPKNLKKHIRAKVKELGENDVEILSYVDKEITNYLQDNKPRPDGPKDNSWFSNFNEDNILRHMMEWCPWFYANPSCLSDFMVDYTETNPRQAELISSKGMNPGKEPLGLLEPEFYKNKGYKCMGCIVNNDIKPNGGTHWIAIFYDIRDDNRHTLEYFNSTGESPRPNIKEWMKSFSELSTRQLGVKCDMVKASNISHQNSRSECGAYSIYYVISRIIGVDYKKFREKKIPDNVVFEFRKCVFK